MNKSKRKLGLTILLILIFSILFGVAITFAFDELREKILPFLEYTEEIERYSWKGGEVILEGESNWLELGYTRYAIYWEDGSRRTQLYEELDKPWILINDSNELVIAYQYLDYQGLSSWINYEMGIYTSPYEYYSYGELLWKDYSYGEEKLIINRLNSWERKELEYYEERGVRDDETSRKSAEWVKAYKEKLDFLGYEVSWDKSKGKYYITPNFL
jgi:hypothetical protein